MAVKLTFQKPISAKPEQVYFALTNRTGMLEWLADKVEQIKADTMSYLLTWKESAAAFGSIVESTENRKIQYQFLTAKEHKLFNVDVFLSADGDKTQVDVEVRGVAEDDLDSVEEFVEKALGNLKSVLEEGINLSVYTRPMLGINIGEVINKATAEEKGYPVEFGIVIPNAIEGLGAKAAGIEDGDIMTEVNGEKIKDLGVFSPLASAKVGDVIKTVVYRGDERLEIDITLSSLPRPKLPASPQDVADKLQKIFSKEMDKLVKVLEGVSDNAAEYKPSPGEWNIKEVLAHLILSTRDLFYWAAALVNGDERIIYTSVMPEKLNSVISCHTTINDLMAELGRVQKESTVFISEITADFMQRKGSLMRLSEYTKQEYMHYDEHYIQIKDNLKLTENI